MGLSPLKIFLFLFSKENPGSYLWARLLNKKIIPTIPGYLISGQTCEGDSLVKNPAIEEKQEMRVQPPGREDPLEQ